MANDVRLVNVETLEDKPLFTLPDDREAVGQNCTKPDGNWLIYIDSPRGSMYRQPVTGAKVVGYHFDSGETVSQPANRFLLTDVRRWPFST